MKGAMGYLAAGALLASTAWSWLLMRRLSALRVNPYLPPAPFGIPYSSTTELLDEANYRPEAATLLSWLRVARLVGVVSFVLTLAWLF